MKLSLISRRELFHLLGMGAALLGIDTTTVIAASSSESNRLAAPAAATATPHVGRGVVADPADIPASIRREHPVHHEITLEAVEVSGKIEPGARYDYMTFNRRVPGPMLRVRRGDTVTLTLLNNIHSTTWHSIDLHAVYGPGGAADILTVLPGKAKTVTFKVMYPGAFTYHCAVPGCMDTHIARGMYGMIVVEPDQGLPKVDVQFYIGQNETYNKQMPGTSGPRDFDSDKLLREQATYVVFNGAYNALTAKYFGAMKAKVGETVRIFMVNGGLNLLSSLHPIGNIWSRAWIMGALGMPPMRFLQSVPGHPETQLWLT